MTSAEVATELRRRAPRPPAYVHSGLLIAIVAVFVILLTTSPQSPPPAIAELAPSAVQQIKDAPTEQSSAFGSGEGGSGGAEPGGLGGKAGDTPVPGIGAETTIATEGKTEVATFLRCVGSPPRQIEDPQSPPCVPYFDPKADNGGATSRGVTRDEIVVVNPFVGVDAKPYVDFFNARFQMYGRRMKVVDANAPFSCSPEEQQSEAERIDKTYQPFASVFWYGCGGSVYNREIARRKVITVASDPNFTEKEMADFKPYIWQYPMARDRLFANYGEWICARLAGQSASHAGKRDLVDMKAEKRRFGLVLSTVDLRPYEIDPRPLEQELAACGVTLSEKIMLAPGGYDSAAIGRLKAAQVTTVMCLCIYGNASNLARVATSQTYTPEWLFGTYGLNDFNYFLNREFPIDQRANVLGLSSQPRQQPIDKTPAVWASDESTGSRVRNGNSEDQASQRWSADSLYRTFLLLASGIQMAGPNLTPATFEAGLQKTVFPNPEHPIKAGKVGFQGGSHAMTTDTVEFFWNNTASPPYTQDPPSTICYVRSGARVASGGYLRGGDPFGGPCDSGAPG